MLISRLRAGMRQLTTVVGPLLLMLTVPSSAAAQESTARRQGFWFLMGLGYGTAVIDCDQCNNDYASGLAGTLALGGTLSEQLLVGVESEWWSREDDGVWTNIGNVSAVGYLFPVRDLGLFLKAGAGVAAFHSTGFGPNPDQFGVGFIAGLGYELPVNRGVSVVPMASYHWGTMGDVSSLTGVSQNLLEFAVAVYIP